MTIVPEQASQSGGFRFGECVRTGVQFAARIQRRANAAEIDVEVPVQVHTVAAFAREPRAQAVQKRVVRAGLPSILSPQSIRGPRVHIAVHVDHGHNEEIAVDLAYQNLFDDV